MIHCTRCKQKKPIVFSDLRMYDKNTYILLFCNDCCINIIPHLLGFLEGVNYSSFLMKNGKETTYAKSVQGHGKSNEKRIRSKKRRSRGK